MTAVSLTARVQAEMRDRMRAASLSQRALAVRLGVTESRVSQMLSDTANLTLGTIEKVFVAIDRDSDGSPQGRDREDGLDAKRDSAGRKASPDPNPLAALDEMGDVK